jgi:hypothetical protein
MNGPALARGFDRATIKQRVRHMNISYPLPPSYRSTSGKSNMERQSLCSTVENHPMYELWLTQEGVDDPTAGLPNRLRQREKLREACTFLGLDYKHICLEARILLEEILAHGEPGTDYLVKADA